MKSGFVTHIVRKGLIVIMILSGLFTPFAFGEEITDQAEIDALGADLTRPATELPPGESHFTDSLTTYIDENNGLDKAFDNDGYYKVDGVWPKRCMCAKSKNYLSAGYTFATPKKIIAYGVTVGQVQWSRGKRDPKKFTLFGTNKDPATATDADWTNLGTGSSDNDSWEVVEKGSWPTENDQQANQEPKTRYFRCQNGDPAGYTSFKWVATESISDAYGYINVSELEFFGFEVDAANLPALDVRVPVPALQTDHPDDFAAPDALATGEVSVTAPPAVYPVTDEAVRYHRVGYELTAYNSETHDYDEVVEATMSADGTTLSFSYEAGKHYRLTWCYDLEYRVTCSAVGGLGTVEPAEAWVKEGGSLNVMAIPNDGYCFLNWIASDGTIHNGASASIPVTAAVTLTAQFWENGKPLVWHVKTDGDDARDGLSPDAAMAMIPAALTAIPDGVDATILVYAGEHALPAEVMLDRSVTIRGETGNPEDVIVKRGGKNHRLFTVNHAEAVLSSLTIQDGLFSDSHAYSWKCGGNILFPSGGACGTVTNCIIRNGAIAQDYNNFGGGVALSGPGLVTHCRITGNMLKGTWSVNGGGLAVYMSSPDAIVRNCLITGNRQEDMKDTPNNRIGTVLIGNGLLENCTIADNSAFRCSGVYATGASARIRNCLIGANTAPGFSENNEPVFALGEKVSAAVFENCVSPVEINETCHVVENPFASAATGDYRPLAGSAAVNGVTDAYLPSPNWMAGSVDIDGNQRVRGSAPDIGAYEVDDAAIGGFFEANVTNGHLPLTVVFTVRDNMANGEYVWNFGDGTPERTTTVGTVEHTFETAGAHAVSLTLRPTAGEPYSPPQVVISAIQKVLYVTPGNAGAWPYATPETAAGTITEALDAACDGCEILLADGDYPVSNTIDILKGVTIRCLNKPLGMPTRVTLSAESGVSPVVRINHAAAELSGVTIQGGSTTKNSAKGGNVLFPEGGFGGTLSNCVVRSGALKGTSNIYGGGLAICSPGLVTHCRILDNSVRGEQKGVNGYDTSGGSGVYMAAEGAVVRNCLIFGNRHTREVATFDDFGAVRISAGLLESCTVVSNSAFKCAGVYAKEENARVLNCLVFANESTTYSGANTAVYSGTVTRFTSCAGDLVIPDGEEESAGDLKSEDGKTVHFLAVRNPFIDAANGDYRLVEGSRVINQATMQPWMTGACDLAGKSRIIHRPDIGCYEFRKNGLKIMLR